MNNPTELRHKDLAKYLLRFGSIWALRQTYNAALRAWFGGLYVAACQLFSINKKIGDVNLVFNNVEDATKQEEIVSARRMFEAFTEARCYPQWVKDVIKEMAGDANRLLSISQLT